MTQFVAQAKAAIATEGGRMTFQRQIILGRSGSIGRLIPPRSIGHWRS